MVDDIFLSYLRPPHIKSRGVNPEIASLYIVIPQQKWNNTYLETTYKLEGEESIANFCFQDKELTRIRIFKFY